MTCSANGSSSKWCVPHHSSWVSCTARAVSAPLHTPQLGGGHAVIEAQNSAVTGCQNSVPSPLSPQRKLRPPNGIWSTTNQWSWRALWKKNTYTLQLLWPPLKVMFLHITAAVVGPFESKIAYWYIAVAVWPLWKQGTLHIAVAIGGPLKA